MGLWGQNIKNVKSIKKIVKKWPGHKNKNDFVLST